MSLYRLVTVTGVSLGHCTIVIRVKQTDWFLFCFVFFLVISGINIENFLKWDYIVLVWINHIILQTELIDLYIFLNEIRHEADVCCFCFFVCWLQCIWSMYFSAKENSIDNFSRHFPNQYDFHLELSQHLPPVIGINVIKTHLDLLSLPHITSELYFSFFP